MKPSPFVTLVAASFTLALVLLACGSNGIDTSVDPAPMEAHDYDQACGADADCVPVAQGVPCGCNVNTQCDATGAINVTAKAKYDADFSERNAECPPQGSTSCTALCKVVSAYCNEGTCALH